MKHVPVMLNEVLGVLDPGPGKIFIDGTFGAGGYSRALLAAGAEVIAFDRDPSVVADAGKLKKEYPGKLRFFNEKFSRISDFVSGEVDGLVLDIGVSSMQIDEAGRGFSYVRDGALLMSMGGGSIDASDVVNEYKEERLADVLWRYGELRNSRFLARKIVAARPVASTLALAEIVGQKFVSRVFQAIRIEVNDELGELSGVLANAASIIKPGGVLAVVSFHSLEDRMVKKFLGKDAVSRYSMASAVTKPFQSGAKNVIIPGEAEVLLNPRAASAKLRFGIRV